MHGAAPGNASISWDGVCLTLADKPLALDPATFLDPSAAEKVAQSRLRAQRHRAELQGAQPKQQVEAERQARLEVQWFGADQGLSRADFAWYHANGGRLGNKGQRFECMLVS